MTGVCVVVSSTGCGSIAGANIVHWGLTIFDGTYDTWSVSTTAEI